MHSDCGDPVVQLLHVVLLVHEEKRKQARGNGWLDEEKKVKEVQLRSSSQKAEHSSELATSKIVSTKVSAVISHCSSSTKQSIGGEHKEMGRRKKRKIIVRDFFKLICDLLVPYLSLSHVVRSQAYMRSSTRITKKFSHITAQKKVFFL